MNLRKSRRQVTSAASTDHARFDQRQSPLTPLDDGIAGDIQAGIDTENTHQLVPSRHSVVPPLRSSSVMPISASELRILSPVAKSFFVRASARRSMKSCK